MSNKTDGKQSPPVVEIFIILVTLVIVIAIGVSIAIMITGSIP